MFFLFFSRFSCVFRLFLGFACVFCGKSALPQRPIFFFFLGGGVLVCFGFFWVFRVFRFFRFLGLFVFLGFFRVEGSHEPYSTLAPIHVSSKQP